MMLCVPPPALAAPELALYTPARWDGRRVLRVRFLDGEPALWARIAAIEAGLEGWSSASAMQFVFGDDPEAEIRVTLAPGGSWSYVGMGCLGVPRELPTMQLGWAHRSDDTELRRVWLHELLHTLGGMHEQESALAVATLPWDMRGVARWCEANDVPLEVWEEQWIRHPIPATVIDHDVYDAESIGGYYIPAEWMLDRVARGGANRLSAGDRRRMAGWYGEPPVRPHLQPDGLIWLPWVNG